MLYKTGRKALFNHLNRLRAISAVRGKADRENISILEAELAELSNRHRALSRMRVALFVLLYASVAGAFVNGWVAQVIRSLTVLGSFLGVGVLSILVLYLTWRMNQIWGHMLVVYGHLAAIYEKHATKTLQKE